jgi:hypothetical protein
MTGIMDKRVRTLEDLALKTGSGADDRIDDLGDKVLVRDVLGHFQLSGGHATERAIWKGESGRTTFV